MGHRANHILIENGRSTIFYSQFGGLGTGVEPLLGPIGLEAYIRRLSGEGGRLLGEPSAEGGVLLDKDERALLFWTKHGPPSASHGFRRAYLALLREEWPGWTVRWALHGQADIIDHLGVDPEGRIQDAGGDPPGLRVVLERLAEGFSISPARNLTAEEFRASLTVSDPSMDTYQETVLTTHLGGGVVMDHSICCCAVPWVLGPGPELVAALSERPGVSMPNEFTVVDGAFIDVERRQIAGWPPPRPRVAAAVAQRWPGWDVRWHDGGLPHQAELAGRDPVHVRLTAERLAYEAGEMFAAHEIAFRLPGDDRTREQVLRPHRATIARLVSLRR